MNKVILARPGTVSRKQRASPQLKEESAMFTVEIPILLTLIAAVYFGRAGW
jgi:hypothetical protein